MRHLLQSLETLRKLRGRKDRKRKKPSAENRHRRGLERLDADSRAKIIILYQEGVSTPDLAKRYGVTSDWLRRTLYPAMGMKPRSLRRDFDDSTGQF